MERTAAEAHWWADAKSRSHVARYYFDTFDGDRSSADSEGIECSEREQVQYQAVNALPDMARESLPNGPNRMFRVEVREPEGKIVFRATLELKSEWL